MTQQKASEFLVAGDLGKFTDIHLPVEGESGFCLFPGGLEPQGEALKAAIDLRRKVSWKRGQMGEGATDWQIEHEQVSFRVHHQQTSAGWLYILRAIGRVVRPLSEVGLPVDVVDVLLSPALGSTGGLVLITGAAGSGKSSTCASVVQARVKKFGSYAVTVEAPVEFSLQGRYPVAGSAGAQPQSGVIIQIPSSRERMATDLRDAMRCFPSMGRGSILMIGEVRDSVEAAHLLQSATNGQLVFATLHADNPIDAITRVYALASNLLGADVTRLLLAQSFRGVISQQLQNGRLASKSLISRKGDSAVASIIARGAFPQLSTELSRQQAERERAPSSAQAD